MTRDANRSIPWNTESIDARQPAHGQVMFKRSEDHFEVLTIIETILIEAIETETVGIISICPKTVLNDI